MHDGERRVSAGNGARESDSPRKRVKRGPSHRTHTNHSEWIEDWDVGPEILTLGGNRRRAPCHR